MGVSLRLRRRRGAGKEEVLVHDAVRLAKYTKTHTIDVGDVPNHQLRIFELHTVYTGEAPVYDGVKVKETLENGDKIYARLAIHSHTAVAADGTKKLGYRAITTLTGGTGRSSAIRGTLLGGGGSDLKSGTTDAWTEGEYWFEK